MREQKYVHIKPSTDKSTKIHIDSINKQKQLPIEPPKPFSLFCDITGTSKATNKEYEQDAEKEKVKYEKQFTMTFEACAQKGDAKPWYAKNSNETPLATSTALKLKSKLTDIQRKERNDPMKSVLKSTISVKQVLQVTGKKTIDQLRKERLNREVEERKRVANTLNKNQPTRHESDSRHYNSQFNPEFVKV